MSEYPKRRIAYADVSLELLSELLFPEGTKIRAASFNFPRLCVEFVVEHPDLDECEEGAEIPTVAVLAIRTKKAWQQ